MMAPEVREEGKKKGKEEKRKEREERRGREELDIR